MADMRAKHPRNLKVIAVQVGLTPGRWGRADRTVSLEADP